MFAHTRLAGVTTARASFVRSALLLPGVSAGVGCDEPQRLDNLHAQQGHRRFRGALPVAGGGAGLVELEVVSTMDTVLAVRRVCEAPLTELACNDGPLNARRGRISGR